MLGHASLIDHEGVQKHDFMQVHAQFQQGIVYYTKISNTI